MSPKVKLHICTVLCLMIYECNFWKIQQFSVSPSPCTVCQDTASLCLSIRKQHFDQAFRTVFSIGHCLVAKTVNVADVSCLSK